MESGESGMSGCVSKEETTDVRLAEGGQKDMAESVQGKTRRETRKEEEREKETANQPECVCVRKYKLQGGTRPGSGFAGNFHSFPYRWR